MDSNSPIHDMAEKKATDERVFAEADALLAEGQKPTVPKIRERTGGSYTTVQEALKRWEEARAAARKNPLPPRSPIRLTRFCKYSGTWRRRKRIPPPRLPGFQPTRPSARRKRSSHMHKRRSDVWNRKPKTVWTGSTNFTSGSFFGQANVAHVITDPEVAATSLSYWEQLKDDPTLSTAVDGVMARSRPTRRT